MSLVVVRARVHADNVEAVAAEAHKMFGAIAAAAPDVGYAVCRGPDGVTFIAVLDAPEGGNPLLAVPAFADFHEGVRAWGAEPPTSEVWEVVGSYRLFERARDPHARSHAHGTYQVRHKGETA